MIEAKYHKALKQIEVLHKDNTNLKQEASDIHREGIQWKNKLQGYEI